MSAYDGQVDTPQILKEAQIKLPNVTLQLFDLDKVAGSRHLLLATFNAWKSFNSKRRISRSLGMEILLFVSGTGQINEAIGRVGIITKTRKTATLALVSSDDEAKKASAFLSQAFHKDSNDKLLDEWTEYRRRSLQTLYAVSNKELEAAKREGEGIEKAIERIAIERSAMLAIGR